MKHRLLATLGSLAILYQLQAETPCYTSRTFMFPRPLYHMIAPNSDVWDELVAHKKDAPCGRAFQALGVYQRSVQDYCPTRGYFSIDCKQTLLVTGDDAPQALRRDIRAEWLGINDPTFEGTLTLQPEQRQAGVILSYNQDLGVLFTSPYFETWWIDITVPIFNVHNRMNTTGSSPEVVQSFTNTDFSLGKTLEFARITNVEQSKTGLGVIELRLGGTFLDHDGFFLDYYAGIGLPAEPKPEPTYLFQPTLGNQTHLVIIAGGHFKMPFIDFTETCNLRGFLDLENRYYVHNYQRRTFDLHGKQWSRYLPVRREGELATIPAANILTRCVRVDPGSYVNLATGLEFSGPSWTFEFAYQLWGHSEEWVRPTDAGCIPREPLFTHYGIAGTTADTSASQSTIAQQANNDPTFIHIREMDINYCSGQAGGSDVQGLHVGIYYKELHDNDTCRNMFLGAGGFIEWPNNNAALHNWGFWFKAGTDF